MTTEFGANVVSELRWPTPCRAVLAQFKETGLVHVFGIGVE